MRSTATTLAIGALTACGMLAVPSAFAADSVSQDVTGGTLTAAVANLTLAGVISTHAAQASTGKMILTVDDSTGTGAGWNVTEQVSSFVYSGPFSGTAIPAADFAITSVDAASSSAGQAIDVTGTDGAPTGPQSGNMTGGVTGSLDSPVKVLHAGATFGQGTYGQGINVTLTVPADSRAGAYTGTLTTTVIAAP